MLSPSSDGLDFDFPDQDPAAVSFGGGVPFSNVTALEDEIFFTGGLIALGGGQGSSFGIQFSVDVPEGIQSFTLRQIAIPVPEPSTLLLVGLGLLPLSVRRARRGPS